MSRVPIRGFSGRKVPAEGFVPGSYLTNGRRLFRVVSQIAAGDGQMFASLEDCLTLEIKAYSPGELYAMRLRPVPTPAGR